MPPRPTALLPLNTTNYYNNSKQQFSSVQAGIYALGKAHKYALHPSLRSFPNVAFETVP